MMRVFVLYVDDSVACFDEVTGVEMWRFNSTDLAGGCEAFGSSIICSGYTTIRKFAAATGAVEETFVMSPLAGGASLFGRPMVHNGIVYFGTWQGFVYALDAANLDLLWNVTLGDTNGIVAPASLWGDDVVVGTLSGKVVALHGLSGAILGMYSTPGIGPYTGGPIFGIQTGVAVTADIALFSTSEATENFIAIDLLTMAQLWNITVSPNGTYAFTTPIASNGVVYTTTYDGVLYGFNLTDGSLVFRYECIDSFYIYGALSIVGCVLIATTDAGYAIGIDVRNYTVLFVVQYAPAGAVTATAAAITIGSHGEIVIAGEHRVYALDYGCASAAPPTTTGVPTTTPPPSYTPAPPASRSCRPAAPIAVS